MKSILNRLRPYISEIVSGSWVIFGLLVAWMLTPEGETRDTIGAALVALSIVWALTMPIRLGGGEN
jgi:hypothetical protein